MFSSANIQETVIKIPSPIKGCGCIIQIGILKFTERAFYPLAYFTFNIKTTQQPTLLINLYSFE